MDEKNLNESSEFDLDDSTQVIDFGENLGHADVENISQDINEEETASLDKTEEEVDSLNVIGDETVLLDVIDDETAFQVENEEETAQSGIHKFFQNTNKKRLLLIILCSVLAIILVGVLALAILGQSLLDRINRFDPDDATLSSDQLESILNQTESVNPDFTGPSVNVEDVTMPSMPAENLSQENVVNFLLVGQDRRPGEGRRHSDATILVTINKSAKTLTMTSFMRDMWVYIPYGSGGFYERINCSYMVGGFKTLNATLEHNFGVSSNHNIEVDFDGFISVIDKIGGVDITLTSAEAAHLNKKNNWSLDAGVNHLTGAQALAYSRIRAIGDDQARTNRQRTVLTALVNKAKTMSVIDLYNMVYDLLPKITTDMSDSEILGYVSDLGPMLSDLTVVSQRIPADGCYSNVVLNDKGVTKYVLMLNEEQLKKNIELLDSAFNSK